MRAAEAAGYASEQGWPVLPIKGKTPLTPRGFKNATTDHTIIENWWREHPNANIGIRTGNGLVVVDVDEEGLDTLHEWAGTERGLPETVSSTTGGGGMHFYLSAGLYLPSRNRVWPGIDVKAAGGYVVAPSSTHSSGRPYEWEIPPDELNPAPIPAWMLRILQRRKPTKPLPAVIPVSERNDTLTSLGGMLARRGLTEREILASLTVVSNRCEGQFSGREVAKIAKSVVSYGHLPWALDAWSYASRVVRAHGLGASACLVLTELYKASDDAGRVSVGRRLISTKTHLNRETVDRAIAKLAAVDVLQVTGGRGRRSLIKLSLEHFPPPSH